MILEKTQVRRTRLYHEAKTLVKPVPPHAQGLLLGQSESGAFGAGG